MSPTSSFCNFQTALDIETNGMFFSEKVIYMYLIITQLCISYLRVQREFAANLRWALTHEPEPLTQDIADKFTWEAATDRLIRSSAITRREGRAMLEKAKLDERIAFFHREMGKGAKGDALRKFLGGGPISAQVKYELAKQGLDEEGSENEGLTQKLAQSSFVRAIKKSFSSTSLDGDAYFTT